MMSVPMTTSSPSLAMNASVAAPPSPPLVSSVQQSAESQNETWSDQQRESDQNDVRQAEVASQAARSVRRKSEESLMDRQARTLRATLEYLRKVISPPPPDGFNEAERKARETAKKQAELAKPPLDIEA